MYDAFYSALLYVCFFIWNILLDVVSRKPLNLMEGFTAIGHFTRQSGRVPIQTFRYTHKIGGKLCVWTRSMYKRLSKVAFSWYFAMDIFSSLRRAHWASPSGLLCCWLIQPVGWRLRSRKQRNLRPYSFCPRVVGITPESVFQYKMTCR